MTVQLRSFIDVRTLLIAVVTVFMMSTGCSSCESCGAEEKAEPDITEPDVVEVEEDTYEEDLEEAEKAAEEAAVMHAVKVNDQARLLAAELEGASAGRQDVPRTRTSGSQPGGTINTKEVLAVFDQHESELKKCYERALKRDPSLAGQVILQVRIEPSGRASSISAQGRSMSDDIMFECMERQAQSWLYPRPEGGAAVVRKPFRFSPDM